MAQGVVILAEHTAQSSDLSGVAAQWLKTLNRPAHRKFTMNYDHHIVNFLADDGYCITLKASAYMFLNQLI